MSDLAARIRAYVEAVPPVEAEMILAEAGTGRAVGLAPATPRRRPVMVLLAAAAAALLLVGGVALAWRLLRNDEPFIEEPTMTTEAPAPSTTLPEATTMPPATTTPPASSTTLPTTTTTLAPEAEEGGPTLDFPEPISIAASDIVGALPAPPGWTLAADERTPEIGIDDGCVLVFPEGEVVEEGESCVTHGLQVVRIYLFPVDQFDGGGPLDPGALAASYLDWVEAIYYSDPPFRFEAMDPEPAPVGSLSGVHFGWNTIREEATWQQGDVYLAVDDTFVYMIEASLGPLDIEDEPARGVAMLAPYLQEIVADMEIPITTTTVPPPAVGSDWGLQPGDLIVAGAEGVSILRGDRNDRRVVATVTAEQTLQAYHDGMSGLVLQQTHPNDTAGVHPAQAAIWWVPEPGAEPIMLRQPEAGHRLVLYGVADVGGSPAVLYGIELTGEHFNEQVLVAHDLTSGTPTEIAVIGGGEVSPLCVSGDGDRFLVAAQAEENTWFDLIDLDGTPIEHRLALPPLWSDRRWWGLPCAALGEDGLAAVTFRDHWGPNLLVIADVASGAEAFTMPLDEEATAAEREAEIPASEPLITRLALAGDVVVVSDLHSWDEPYLVYLDDGSVEVLPALGMASPVR